MPHLFPVHLFVGVCIVVLSANSLLAGPTITTVTTVDTTMSCALAPLTAPNSLPIGPYCASVLGTGFTPDVQVTVGGRPVVVLNVNGPTQLTIAGAGVAAWDGSSQPLIATAGGSSSTAFQVFVGTRNAKTSWAAASRLLEQAAFGPKHADVLRIQQIGVEEWITEQLRWTKTPPYGDLTFQFYNDYQGRFCFNALNAPDQLRQRVAFALSQLFVVSSSKVPMAATAYYHNMLYDLAFTSYPALLRAVTKSTAMGFYLDMAGSAKASADDGTRPNENYAREVLQLFSIGTVLLDSSAQPVTTNGHTIAAYNQDTISNFARAFTGWGLPGGQVFETPEMVSDNSRHDTDIPKRLLTVAGGPTLSYEATTNGNVVTELDQALANIASHPNVAPFITKVLIQHLVTSNPSPNYIQRVAKQFAKTGGDMKTVLRAILTDSEARAGDLGSDSNADFGHLTEPAQWLSSMCRALNITAPDLGNNLLYVLSGALGQVILTPPSVFNFYSPTHLLPPSLGLNGRLLAPEFQINTAAGAYQRLLTTRTSGLSGSINGAVVTSPNATIDLSPYANIAGIPDLLVDALEATMTHGHMPAAMKTRILAELQNAPSPFARTSLAVFLVATSSYYQVNH
jgi:uncharacterized protein (DUF1800 family)